MGRWSAARLVVASLAWALVVAAFPAGAGAYDPYDFAHPATPHVSVYSGGQPDPALSPANAVGSIPLLVLYAQFSDVYPGSAVGSPRSSASALAGTIFTGFPSVTGLFLANSGGRFGFVPVRETSGTQNDGVVSVQFGTVAATMAMQLPPIGLALKAAEPFVDYATLDTNGDGCLAESELTVLVIGEEPGNNAGTAPGNVAIPGDGLLGGKRFAAPPCRNNSGGIRAAGYASTYSPVFDYSHEIAHARFHLWDLYGAGGAKYDPTGVPPGNQASSFNAWTRMHLGWMTPTVVTADGYYTVTAGTGSPTEAYLLYDDQQGTNDYFLVENRVSVPGGYDAGVPDSGLLVWRVRDSWYGDTSDNAATPPRWARPGMTIMRPDGALPSTCSGLGSGPLSSCNGCSAGNDLSGSQVPGTGTVSCIYGGRPDDLWDAADTTTQQREMTGRTWQDGVTPSNVGMFAVPPSGSAMRVYFDVRGPGVLVDCGYPAPAPLASAGETITIPITVRNTGETFDTFVFTAANLPAGWTVVTPVVLGLNAQEQQSTQVQVRVGGNETPGTYPVDLAGFSTGASGAFSSCPVDVNVDQGAVGVFLFAPSTVIWGDGPTFAALVRGLPSTPLAGVSVRFTLTGDSQTNLLAGADAGPIPSQTVLVTANGSGVASATPLITVPPGVYTLSAAVQAGGGWASGRATQMVSVGRRPTSIQYTGAVGGQYSDPVSLSAYLTDAALTTPIAGSLEFRVGTQAVVASGGGGDEAITGTLVLDQPMGDHVVGIGFPGNVYYAPSAAHARFAVAREGLLVTYTGTTQSTTAAKRNTVSIGAVEDDGTFIVAGDLTRAEFDLRIDPTIGHGTSQHTRLHLGSDGTASWALGNLAADVYRVGARTPDTNPWYEGALALPTELVVASTAARLTGSGTATDTAGAPVTVDTDVAVTAKYGVAGRFSVRFRDQLGEHTVAIPSPAWVAQNHGKAIAQGPGSLDGQAVVVRIVVEDGGSHVADRIWVRVRDQLGTTLYESGAVPLTSGDLRVG